MFSLIKNKYPYAKTIFEIGAHRGKDLLEIRNTWKDSYIHAFEADPFNYKLCYNFSQEYNIENIEINNNIVSDVCGLIDFYRYDDIENIDTDNKNIVDNIQRTGQGSMLKLGKGMKEIFKVREPKEVIKVESITLKKYCLEKKISPDIIFMDVQGAEYNVLVGLGEELLLRTQCILLEWSENVVMYEGEQPLSKIEQFLNLYGFKKTTTIDQLPGISGDSIFERN